MPRYSLRVPGPGTVLYGDGDQAMVAATIADAREFWEDETGEPQPYLHSYIGACRVAYKRDVDAGDVPDDTEPGDTYLDYLADNGRELRAHEVRVWMRGAPPIWWTIEHMLPAPVAPDEIPVGTHVHHTRLGSGRTTRQARHHGGRRWFVDVDFGWPTPERRLACSVLAVHFLPSRGWPPRRVRLTVADELVVESVTRETAEALRDVRVARLTAEWEAANHPDREAIPA